MSALLLHGNPDDATLWDALLRELDLDDAVVPTLPGFAGTPLPDGFDATRWAYRDWLVERLEELDEPPHVVATDFGSVILHGVLVERPELVRSWALSNSAHEDYVWAHARRWQTTRIGEQMVDAWETLEEGAREQVLATTGLHPERIPVVAGYLDRTHLECAMAFYRSVAYMGDWQLQPGGDYPPGLVLWGSEEEFQALDFGRTLAQDTGSRLVVLEGAGHWWPIDRPAEAAQALREFWEGL